MRLSVHRSFAVTFALCAMVLRALLPDGWMPAPAGAAAPFIICSVDGVHTGGKQPADPAQEHTHAPCAFAAAAHLAPPDVGALALVTPAEAGRIVFAATAETIAAARLYRPNTPRAPPAFS